MKKLLFLALAAASFSLASCGNDGSLEGTSDGSVNDGTVDAGIRRQDTASATSGGAAPDTAVVR